MAHKHAVALWVFAILFCAEQLQLSLAAAISGGVDAKWPSILDVRSLGGFTGSVIAGREMEFSVGSQVAAGDLNGDGVDDIVVLARELYTYMPDTVFGYIFWGSASCRNDSQWYGSQMCGLSSLHAVLITLRGGCGDLAVCHPLSAAIADVNGDGTSDAIIGMRGMAYIVLGHAKGFKWPDFIELSEATDSVAFRLDGTYAIAAADITGDGVADMISGPDANGTFSIALGGKHINTSVEFKTLRGAIVTATAKGDNISGASVSANGDINGDGITDMAFGASASGTLGRVFLVFGTASLPSYIDLSSLASPMGVILDGSLPQFGYSISLGDFTGDNISDILVGLPSGDGRIIGIFGRNGTWPSSIALSSFTGQDSFLVYGKPPGSGLSVDVVGDVNSDGIGDIAFCNGNKDSSLLSSCIVMWGMTQRQWLATGGTVDLRRSRLNGVEFQTDEPYTGTGGSSEQRVCCIRGLGDINQDRMADIAVLCPIPMGTSSTEKDELMGQLYIAFGDPGPWPFFPVPLKSLQITNSSQSGHEISGCGWTEDFGASSSSAGDVNGDRIMDFVAGAPLAPVVGRRFAGRVSIIFGHNGQWNRNSIGVDNLPGFEIMGSRTSQRLGTEVQQLGDVNGDGYDDFSIRGESDGISEWTRTLYIVFGRPAWPEEAQNISTLPNVTKLISPDDFLPLEPFPKSSDFNGDKLSDIVVYTSGNSYVIFGSSKMSEIIQLRSLELGSGFIIQRSSAQKLLIGKIGDVNCDGIDDLFVAESLKYHVVFGHFGSWVQSLTDFDSINGTNGFLIDGSATPWATTLLGLGDVNSDGCDDIALGSASEYSFIAGRNHWLQQYDNFSGHMELNGVATAIGDLDGDKLPETAFCNSTICTVLWGRAKLLSTPFSLNRTDGVSTELIARSSVITTNLGCSSIGDVNNDSIADILIADSASQMLYVVFGNNPPRMTTNISQQPGCCSATVGIPFVFTIDSRSFFDISDKLNVTVSPLYDWWPSWLVYTPENMTFSGTPREAGYSGEAYLVVTVTDRHGLSLTQNFDISVSTSLTAINIDQTLSCSRVHCLINPIVISTPGTNVRVSLTVASLLTDGLFINGRASDTNRTALVITGSRDSVNAQLTALQFETTLRQSSITVSVTDSYGQQISGEINVVMTSSSSSSGSKVGAIAGGVSAAVFVMGISGFGVFITVIKKRRIDSNEEKSDQRVWSPDLSLIPNTVSSAGYKLIPAGEQDFTRVSNLYARCPVPGKEIASVDIIWSPVLEKLFRARVGQLQGRYGNRAFDPSWIKQGKMVARASAAERLEEMASGFRDEKFPNVSLLPMWHGTGADTLDSILRTGFANLALTDEGFFGKGIYNAVEARYAHEVYNRGVLLVNWVSFYSAFPVVDGDMNDLKGKGNYGNYDAHFAPVEPANRDNRDCNSFVPCKSLEDALYHELVVFEATQCLPRYVVKLRSLSGVEEDSKPIHFPQPQSSNEGESNLRMISLMDLKQASIGHTPQPQKGTDSEPAIPRRYPSSTSQYPLVRVANPPV